VIELDHRQVPDAAEHHRLISGSVISVMNSGAV